MAKKKGKVIYFLPAQEFIPEPPEKKLERELEKLAQQDAEIMRRLEEIKSILPKKEDKEDVEVEDVEKEKDKE